MKYLISIVCFSLFGSALLAQVEVNFPTKDPSQLENIRDKATDIDLNGLWEGEVNQLNWKGQPEFAGTTGKFHVEITQKGNKVEGLFICRAKFANNQGYLSYEKSFNGVWDGQKLQYKDISVDNYINTHREMRHLEACLKSAVLDFYRTSEYFYLEGTWSGQGHITDVACTPGKIKLRKVAPEEFMMEEATTVNVNFQQSKKGPVELKWDKDLTKVKKIKDRDVKEGKVITVDSTFLRITVYDHKRNDGDIISLNYNGNWILERFVINNAEHHLDVVLDPNEKAPNYLLLYAHNLGASPPNTVAVIVDDGVKRQQFILNSDMNTSDVIYFEYNAKK